MSTPPPRGTGLSGRRILVVGAGTRPSPEPNPPAGIGRTICRRAALAGAHVVAADRDDDAARTTSELVSSEGGTCYPVTADATDEQDVSDMVATAAERLGGLDGVVVNVGVSPGGGPAGTSPAQWDLTVTVNLRAPFLVARRALEVLEPGGAMVFMGSIAGLRAGSSKPAYDTTKAGLEGLVRHIAVEAAPDRRANLVHPGMIDTPMGRDTPGGRPELTADSRIPLRRYGTADDIAAAVVWLLGPDSSYITGQHLVVDGGLTCH